MKEASGCGDFEPGIRSTPGCSSPGRGLLHRPIAGVDVRGDGNLRAYRGGLRREELDPTDHGPRSMRCGRLCGRER